MTILLFSPYLPLFLLYSLATMPNFVHTIFPFFRLSYLVTYLLSFFLSLLLSSYLSFSFSLYLYFSFCLSFFLSIYLCSFSSFLSSFLSSLLFTDLPRPISSARIPLMPFSCNLIIQFRPSNW